METLVATVLIVIIFMISSMLMNTIFASSIKKNTSLVSERLNQLQYEYQSGNISIPYFEELEPWEISILKEKREGLDLIVFKGTNADNQRTIEEMVVDEK